MNKKIISKILVIITVLGIMIASNASLAYSGDGYTIDVPSTFTSTGGAVWAKSTGDSVNIQVQSNIAGEAATYTTLNELVEQVKKAYSITVEKQEVTTLNGYDCLHLVYSMSGCSIEQYAIPTKEKIYIITLGGISSDFLSSSEAREIVNSFKITNYVKPGSSSGTSTGTNTGSNSTSNTTSNNTSNTLTNTGKDNDTNTSKRDVDDVINNIDDDDEDGDENKTSKKKSSSDDEEDKDWVIIAIVAGASVLCVAIIGIVVAVVVTKGKNKNQ